VNPVPCPSCSAPLGLRLLPDFTTSTFCLACDAPIPVELLVQVGIPADLIERLKAWDRRSPKITGVGIESDLGLDLDDRQFVVAWKEVREETFSLLTEFRRHLPAEADVVADVFATRKPEEWTDGEIAAWRRQGLRLRLILEYGGTRGEQFMEEGGAPPGDSDPLPIPIPTILRSDEERAWFDEGFRLGARFKVPVGGVPSQNRGPWRDRLIELERDLGVR
jgi:hypothetical protein